MKSSLLQNFYKYVAQTSDEPLAIEIDKAEGCYFFDSKGKKLFEMTEKAMKNMLSNHNKANANAE